MTRSEYMGPTEEREESALPLGGKHDQIETHSDQQKHRPFWTTDVRRGIFYTVKNFTGLEPIV